MGEVPKSEEEVIQLQAGENQLGRVEKVIATAKPFRGGTAQIVGAPGGTPRTRKNDV